MRSPTCPGLFWCLVSSTVTSAQEIPQWVIEEVGGASGENSTAHCVNERGFIAGRADHRAAAWLGGGRMELRQPNHTATASDAWDINAFGVAVGHSFDVSTGDQVATLWMHNTGIVVGALPGGRDSFAHAINDQHFYVGSSTTSAHTLFHAFVGSLGTLVDLHPRVPWAGGESHAWDINEAGLIVGEASDPVGYAHAVVWKTDGGIEDVGSLGGTNTTGRGLNEAGDVVGSADTPTGDQHAFLSVAVAKGKRSIRDLGKLPGGGMAEGLDVNSQREVVGWAHLRVGSGAVFVAIYWTEQAGMIDLNAHLAHPDWHLEQAESINDAGDIVGYGWHFPSAERRGFLLRHVAR